MAITDNAYSGKVTAGGILVLTVRPFARQTWTVSQVSTEMGTAPLGSTCVLRKNGSQITAMISTGDVADGVPPTVLHSSDVLTVEWAGCTPNALGKAYIIFDDGTPA